MAVPAFNVDIPLRPNDTTSLQFGCSDREVLELVSAGIAPNTRRAYESDLRHFKDWGGSIPSTPMQVAAYLAAYARKLSASTLARRLVSIGRAHTIVALPSPTQAELVRLTLRGIRRKYGVPQRRVAALMARDVVKITSLPGNSLKDLRDRALLLLGFAGAFRRSELVAVDCSSLRWVTEGLLISVPRSKSDQEGRGREVLIPYGRGSICPVKALDAWLSSSGIADGPVFRSVRKGGQPGRKRLSSDAVAWIIKRLTKEAGLDPARYSGHSLRAGFVTSAAAIGMPTWKIKAQTGHATDAMVSRYIRQAELLDWNFSDALL